MAAELQCPHASGKVVYALVRDTAGRVFDGAGFGAYATANLADYTLSLVEQGTASGYYVGDFPAVGAGVYNVAAFERAGGSPAEGDPLVAIGTIEWDGTAVVPLASRLAPTVPGRTLDVSATGEAGLDWANVGSPSAAVALANTTIGLHPAALADVRAVLADLLHADTLAELTGVPPASPTIAQALAFLYMALRNETTVTATQQRLKNHAGATIATAALADDGSTFSRGQFA
jgi:hypothetical protein